LLIAMLFERLAKARRNAQTAFVIDALNGLAAKADGHGVPHDCKRRRDPEAGPK